MESIEAPQVLLENIRLYGLSMQQVANRTGISLAALYRIHHGAQVSWKTQGKLWALLQQLEGNV